MKNKLSLPPILLDKQYVTKKKKIISPCMDNLW